MKNVECFGDFKLVTLDIYKNLGTGLSFSVTHLLKSLLTVFWYCPAAPIYNTEALNF